MKTLVLFYSYTGKTKKLAQDLSGKLGADIFEIKDEIRPGKLKAYTAGCVAAIRMKRTPIEQIDPDLNMYEKIIIMAPVWAGHPAPPINNIFDILPSGKSVEMIMVSASGSSDAKEKIGALVSAKSCTLDEYKDMKGNGQIA